MFLKPKNEADAGTLLEELKKLDAGKLREDDCNILREIMAETPYTGLRDLICLTLVEAEDEELYPYLIKKIKENIHTKYVSTLIYCASHYDCSDDVQVFVDLLILKSDMAFADAYGAFSNMDSIDDEELSYAINKLKAYLETISPDNNKYSDIEAVIEFLKKQDKPLE